MTDASSLYGLSVNDNKGNSVDLSKYEGKVTLVVNVASKCGFTKQYKGLQAVQEKFQDRGFEVLAFPCNQFGSQEPGTNEEIEAFVCENFKTTFPIFDKVNVNGDDVAPVYQYLKEEQKGILGTTSIKWNFTKFLVGKDGHAVHRYASTTTPESMEEDIEKLL